MSTEEPRLSETAAGIRVITEVVPSVRSVALGLWVRTGSRDETPAQAGVSHFLEHLLFKGTPNYSAIEISERFDGLGALYEAPCREAFSGRLNPKYRERITMLPIYDGIDLALGESDLGPRGGACLFRLVGHGVPLLLLDLRCYTGTFQMSFEYSRIVRSDENQPMRAVFRIAFFHQSDGLDHRASTCRCAAA